MADSCAPSPPGSFATPKLSQFRPGEGLRYVVEDDGVVDLDDDDSEAERGKMLHVIDIQSGDILQRVRDLQIDVASEIRVDGDEIYIADYGADKVVVLQLAGSEA